MLRERGRKGVRRTAREVVPRGPRVRRVAFSRSVILQPGSRAVRSLLGPSTPPR